MSFLFRIVHIAIITLLTVITQVGGLIYLLCLIFYHFADNWYPKLKKHVYYKPGLFIVLYLLFTLLFIPFIASIFGRVPLPLFSAHIKPLSIITVLLNRHYVNDELLRVTQSAAQQLDEKYPGTITYYLDANFPFIEGFPLLPHLSHNDGKKLDLAFYYVNKETDKYSGNHPSPIGYGIYEDPLSGELNQPQICADRGFWQYSAMEHIVPQWNKNQFSLDNSRTRAMVEILTRQRAIEKIFIEPHLKNRLGLTSSKIRYHGCQAVRHDDHLHIQIN